MSTKLESSHARRQGAESVVGKMVLLFAIGLHLTSCDSKDDSDPGTRADTKAENLARRGNTSRESVPLRGAQLQAWAKSRFEAGFADGANDPIVDLRDRVWTLDTEELIALIKGLELGEHPSGRALADLAFQRLAHLDPAATLNLLVSNARTNLQFGVEPILRIAMDSDLEVVLAWMKQQEIDNPDFQKLVEESMILLGERSPVVGFRLAAQLSDGGKKRVMLSELFYSWAERDATTAMRFVHENLTGKEVLQMQGNIISGLARTDPESAFRMMEAAADPMLTRMLTANVFAKWFRSDSDGAMVKLGELSPAAVQIVLQSSDNLTAVLAQDPGAAIEVLSQVVLTDATTGIFSQAVQQLTARDADLTLEWLESFPDSPARKELFRSAYEGMLQENPGGVGSRLLGGDARAAHREYVIDAVASVLGRADPDSALLWSSANLDSAAERGAFIGRTFQAALASNPLRAVELMGDNTELFHEVGDAQQASLWSRAGAIYARHDPGSSANWVQGLPDSARMPATEGLVRVWAGSDPEGLTVWIGSLEAGPQYEVAVRTFAGALEESDPKAAAAWLSTLHESE